MKKSFLPFLITGAVIIVGSLFFLYWSKIRLKEFSWRTWCESDADCVIISIPDSANPCCDRCDVETVSYEGKEKLMEWRGGACAEEYSKCPIWDCYIEREPVPKCVKNRCEISWKDRSQMR